MEGAEDIRGLEEDAAIEAAQERSFVPHESDVLKSEHARILKGHPRDVALKKWGPELEEMIMRDLELLKRKDRK
jgi:hypothetical protein